MGSVDFKVVFIPSKLFPFAEAAGEELFKFTREAIQKIRELSGGAWEAAADFSAENPAGVIRNAVRKKVEKNWEAIEQICNPELQAA